MIDNVRDRSHAPRGYRAQRAGRPHLADAMAVFGAVAGAIYTELRKPPEERTWHGKLLGVVPYDFRVPSIEQLRQAYWNPRSPKVFTDRPFGVGWAVNIPTALRRLGVRQEFTKGR